MQQKKGVTFKEPHKKAIKIIYLSLTLLFYLYFYSHDSLTHRKLSKALYIKQLSSYYIDLLSDIPRYCCPVEIFILSF